MKLSPTSFQIGPENGKIMVRTGRQGLGARAGHDLVLEATRWTGQVRIESGDPPSGEVEVRVDPAGLEVREGHGGVKPLTDGDRREIQATLMERIFPSPERRQISFRSVEAAPTGADSLSLAGQLTIGERSRTEDLEVTLEGVAGSSRARGRIKVRQSDFGIKPYTAFMGALKVADEVEVEFDLGLPEQASAG